MHILKQTDRWEAGQRSAASALFENVMHASEGKRPPGEGIVARNTTLKAFAVDQFLAATRLPLSLH